MRSPPVANSQLHAQLHVLALLACFAVVLEPSSGALRPSARFSAFLSLPGLSLPPRLPLPL